MLTTIHILYTLHSTVYSIVVVKRLHAVLSFLKIGLKAPPPSPDDATPKRAIPYELWVIDRILSCCLTHPTTVLLCYCTTSQITTIYSYHFTSLSPISVIRMKNKKEKRKLLLESHCMPMQSRNLMGTSGACPGLNSARLHSATTFANARHSALVWYVLRVAKLGFSAVIIFSFT